MLHQHHSFTAAPIDIACTLVDHPSEFEPGHHVGDDWNPIAIDFFDQLLALFCIHNCQYCVSVGMINVERGIIAWRMASTDGLGSSLLSIASRWRFTISESASFSS